MSNPTTAVIRETSKSGIWIRWVELGPCTTTMITCALLGKEATAIFEWNLATRKVTGTYKHSNGHRNIHEFILAALLGILGW